MALESRSENSRHISVDPQYNNNRPKEKKSADSKRKDRKGDDNDNKRAEPLWHIILLNLIPFLVATGTYFLVYVFLPGVGYLHIFYSFLMALGVLGVLEGVISGLPVKRDLSMYVVLLVFILAGFTAINYHYSSVSPTPAQQTTSAPASILYSPGVYDFYLAPGESGPKSEIIVSWDCHYSISANSHDFIIVANGKQYYFIKHPIITRYGDVQLSFMNNGNKPIHITLVVRKGIN